MVTIVINFEIFEAVNYYKMTNYETNFLILLNHAYYHYLRVLPLSKNQNSQQQIYFRDLLSNLNLLHLFLKICLLCMPLISHIYLLII